MIKCHGLSVPEFNRVFQGASSVYGCKLDWSVDKKKPSFLRYPGFIETRAEGSSRVPNVFYYVEMNRKKEYYMGHRLHEIEHASRDLEEIKEFFNKSVERCMKGRLAWLQDQEPEVERVGNAMIKKCEKL